MVIHACNPSTERAEAGRSLGAKGQPVYSTDSRPTLEDPASHNQSIIN